MTLQPRKYYCTVQVGIDLIGYLPKTLSGYGYTVTLMNYFSKWPEAAPLKDKRAEHSVLCRYRTCICNAPLNHCTDGVPERTFAYTITTNKLSLMSTVLNDYDQLSVIRV